MTTVSCHGYDDATCLQNASGTRVVLTGHGGGRVLEYAIGTVNAVYLGTAHCGGEGQEGWKWVPGQNDDGPPGGPVGGRLDIGPEMLNPDRPTLWLGSWAVQVTSPLSATMTSDSCPATGAQLLRHFVLAGEGSRLSVTQVIRNCSDSPKKYFHWSRSFTHGGGKVVIPLSPDSRYPSKFVQYCPGGLDMKPSDPRISEHHGPTPWLEITGAQHPKLGIDSHAGWFTYLMDNGLQWVKRYPSFPDRVYGEVAGFPLCIYYPEGSFVELEPIGPRETIAPGGESSFTEEWYLLPHEQPIANGEPVDMLALTQQLEEHAPPPSGAML